MMRRPVLFHIAIDADGGRCCRMRSAAEARRCREQRRLMPKLVWMVPCGVGREIWRNGLHRRRWIVLCEQVRGDRRCFLTTMKRPPLVPPIEPFD
ncbi:MAG TPA: hypothetical protein VE650_17555 [Acetobacteraceae bacterium]|jgi:hypothetical protein|nr:hypothetical protein [Acetobacteraceae bacterium]